MTMRKRYGCDFPAQNKEIFNKQRKRAFNFDGLWFDSQWEVEVYKFCKGHNLEIEYQPNIIFKYEYNNIQHNYFPDFLIEGKIYEIKGDHFFRINESGEQEMFCPYRDETLSDSEYNQLCGLYNAKYQCMINNGVKIISAEEMKDLNYFLLKK